MGRKKTIDKEPVTIRFKELANGNKSIYLDIYMDGKRSYEFLKLYLIPEVGRERAKARAKNTETMASANIIKAQRVLDLKNRKAGGAAISCGWFFAVCGYYGQTALAQRQAGWYCTTAKRGNTELPCVPRSVPRPCRK